MLFFRPVVFSFILSLGKVVSVLGHRDSVKYELHLVE